MALDDQIRIDWDFSGIAEATVAGDSLFR